MLEKNQLKIQPEWYQQLYQNCRDSDPEKRPDINQVYKKVLDAETPKNRYKPITQSDDSGLYLESN